MLPQISQMNTDNTENSICVICGQQPQDKLHAHSVSEFPQQVAGSKLLSKQATG